MKRTIIIISFMMLNVWMVNFNLGLCQEIRYASVHHIQGQVMVKKADDSQWQGAQEGMKLLMKDEIKTDLKSTVHLLLDRGGETAQIYIKEASRLRINTLGFNSQTGDKRTLLDLAIGRIVVHVAKLKGNSKFEVNTPTSTMGVRGTTFEVVVEEKKMDKALTRAVTAT